MNLFSHKVQQKFYLANLLLVALLVLMPLANALADEPAPDTTFPNSPNITTSTPLPGEPTTNTAVSITWAASIDPVIDGAVTSGVAGYSYVLDQNLSTDPGTTVTGTATTFNTTLTPGTWYFHIRAIDNAGNTSDVTSYGPIVINAPADDLPDHTFPPSPNIISSVPVPESTSTNPAVSITWTESVDPIVAGESTSGLAGYNYLFDQTPSTVPGTTITGTSTTFNTTLTPGTWYFHIRAIDNAGNASDVDTYGPLLIAAASSTCTLPDATFPNSPNVTTSTPLPNSSTTNPAVSVTWTESIDPVDTSVPPCQITSGIAGYGYLWDKNLNTAPDHTVTGTTTTFNTTLTPGTWYFHIRAIDNAGNASDVTSYGPILIDATTTLPQCSDGVDNDGDGKIDSADPGCSSPTDNDETDTPPGGGGGGGSSSGGGGGGFVSLTSNIGPAPTLPESCPVYLKKFIRLGYDNDPQEVRKLQAFLKVFEGANIEVTGTYTQTDFEAVQAFQLKYANDVLGPWGIIDSTGYVYITTTLAINNIYCHRSTANDLDLRHVFGNNVPTDIGQVVEPVNPDLATTTLEVSTSTATTTLQTNASTTPGFFQAAAVGVLKFIASYPWWWWLIIALIIVLLIWSLQADDNLSDTIEKDSPIDSNTPTQ